MNGIAKHTVSMFSAYRRLDRPSPENILASYIFPQEDLVRAWVEYHELGMQVGQPYPEPTITEVCPNSIEFVIAPRTLAINGYEFAHLERCNDEYSYNYMSSHPDGRCYMFSGEMRLLRLFLEIMSVYFRTGIVRTALTRSRNLAMPPIGMNAGFGFEEWQEKAKICDCILFLG